MDLVTLILACSLYMDNTLPYAMIQVESHNTPLMVTHRGIQKTFKTMSSAIHYTQQQLAKDENLTIGLMQIPSQWFKKNSIPLVDLFRPCKNLVIATQILEMSRLKCESIALNSPTIDIPTCTLSLYKTKQPFYRLAYAGTVIQYAKTHPFAALVKEASHKPKSSTIVQKGSSP